MITFNLDEDKWTNTIDQAGFPSLTELQKINLAVALEEASHYVLDMVDAGSAEGEIRREIARRMHNLTGEALAAGKYSDMWNDQNSRFYKQRQLIMGKSA